MATNKNITMRQYNGTDYDTLYPKTIAAQVDDVYNKSETREYVNSVVPKGTIVLWRGTSATIPNGWVLCDGSYGTPDLRNRFVVGAGDEYSVGNIGGVKNYSLKQFNHTGGNWVEDLWAFKTVTTLDNRPPYYALCYIMKNY